MHSVLNKRLTNCDWNQEIPPLSSAIWIGRRGRPWLLAIGDSLDDHIGGITIDVALVDIAGYLHVTVVAPVSAPLIAQDPVVAADRIVSVTDQSDGVVDGRLRARRVSVHSAAVSFIEIQ